MRIAHITPYYPPYRVGGVGEYSRHLHEELLVRGADSKVVTVGTEHRNEVIAVSRSALGWLLRSALWLRRNRPTLDIVHLHSAGESLPALAAAKSSGLPVLATFHVQSRGIARSLQPYEAAGRRYGESTSLQRFKGFLNLGLRHRMDCLAARRSTRVNAISRYGAVECAEICDREVDVVLNGIPDLSADAVGAATDPVLKEDVILFVGVDNLRKRVALLPEILYAVRKRHPRIRLRIAGFEPHTNPSLERRLEALGLGESVDFLGVVASEDLQPHYRSTRCLVLPSAYEGLPLVLLEAARAGLPAVVTDVAGHPEVVKDGESGFVVPVDDPLRMAERISDLLDSEQLQSRFSRRARAIYEGRFRVQTMVDGYVELYERCLAATES